MDANEIKRPYVCGPLTELSVEEASRVKAFYACIADVTEQVLGVRAFVPHEHYDPIKHKDFTPAQIDQAERHQVCDLTSLLIAVPLAPSWGSGIEVEMANQNGVPVVLLCEKKKMAERRVSRLLRGNPAIDQIIEYEGFQDALEELIVYLELVRKELLIK